MATLNVRNIDGRAAERIKAGARARGWTAGRYLAALVDLHDAMRALADTPTADGRWQQIAVELEALGLETRHL